MQYSSKDLDHYKTNESLINSGSFWSDSITEKQKGIPLALVQLCHESRLVQQTETIIKQLLNSDTYSVENIHHPFSDTDVVFTGDNTFDASLQADAAHQLENRFDQGNRGLWMVKLEPVLVTKGLDKDLEELVIPIRIKGSYGTDLILNSDFYVRNNYICFLRDPVGLFSENKFLITLGTTNPNSIYSFPLRVSAVKDAEYLVNFARLSQSAKNFRLVLAELGGLKVITETQFLVHKSKDLSKFTYTFETEIITVDYPHQELQVGKRYTADTIIGDGIKLYTPDGTQNWWKKIDFKGGIALNSIADSKNILIPNETVMSYVADVDTNSNMGDKAHVRVELIGEPDDVDAYWDLVEVQEKTNNIYLNEVIGIGRNDVNFDDQIFSGILNRVLVKYEDINKVNDIFGWQREYRNLNLLKDPDIIKPSDPTTSPDPAIKYVNALDVFFKSVLKDTAVVILIDYEAISKNFHRVCKFIENEQPAGCTMIVIINCPSKNDTYDLATIGSSEYNSFHLTVSEDETSYDLNSIIVDSFTAELNT